jgi:hypothetical protein
MGRDEDWRARDQNQGYPVDGWVLCQIYYGLLLDLTITRIFEQTLLQKDEVIGDL